MILAVAGLAAAPGAAAPPEGRPELSSWKLTLPVAGERSKHAREILWPELATFEHPDFFFASPSGLVFRAHCGGATTSGSRYPRCELREMEPGGARPASWGTDDGRIHTMTLSTAILRTPSVKPHVVCAQIHDATDDLLMIRLEGTRLFVERAGADDVPLDPAYRLGAWFDLTIEAGGGRVRVWHNGRRALEWAVVRGGCYFKAGCYTQSNTSRGDRPDDAGEVIIRRLAVSHRPPTP